MPALGILSLALVVWSLRTSQRAKREGRGLRVISLGIFVQGFGLVLGAHSVIASLGKTSWEQMVLEFLTGSALGLWAATHRVKKWERALQKEGALPRRVRKWWNSWAFILALLLVLTIFALWSPLNLLPQAFWDAAGALSFAQAGFFVAFGLRVFLWARRKERESLEPLVIPTSNGK